jgi:hypothetical protein
MGMKIQKFHLVLHFVKNIRKFGSMKNFCSMIGEMLHKTEQKDPSYNTQRTEETFEIQTSYHYVENLKIMRALFNDILAPKDPFDYTPLYQTTQKNDDDTTVEILDSEDDSIISKEKQKYIRCKLHKKILYDFESNNVKKQRRRSRKFDTIHFKDCVFENQLQKLCSNLINDKRIDCEQVECYASCKREKIIYRGDPLYQLDHVWYDWVNVKWLGVKNKTVPAKILLFMDLRKSFRKKFIVGTSEVTEAGIYAVAYTLAENVERNNAHQISRLCKHGRLMKNRKNEFELVMFNVNSIDSPQIAVPYRPNNNNIDAEEWLFIEPRKYWYEIFVNMLKEGVKNCEVNEDDASISNNAVNEENMRVGQLKKRKRSKTKAPSNSKRSTKKRN